MSPRKTLSTLDQGYPVTPYELGEQLIDDEGDSMAQNDADALRVYPVGLNGAGEEITIATLENSLTNVESMLGENLEELKKIRRANEVIIDEEVMPLD